MYTFLIDKPEIFKCQLSIEGADLAEASARLVLKEATHTVLFDGQIDSNGVCTVPVKNLKKLFKEDGTGKVLLEVIVDGTYFVPWEDDCQLKMGKKVAVEVLSNNKPLVENTVKVQAAPVIEKTQQVAKPLTEHQILNKHSDIIVQILTEQGINSGNVSGKQELLKNVLLVYLQETKTKVPVQNLLKEILRKLK